MIPIAGCAMMVEMCCVVISVPECFTFNAQAYPGPPRVTKNGSAQFVR